MLLLFSLLIKFLNMYVVFFNNVKFFKLFLKFMSLVLISLFLIKSEKVDIFVLSYDFLLFLFI